MKIAIVGYSGSGKSTLAQILSELYGVDALYLDAVHFLPQWKERPREEEYELVKKFLDTHEKEGWVVDGTYSRLEFQRRMEEADEIVFLDFNRFTCLFRALKRYKNNKGKTRVSMAEGCEEKMDFSFVWWILWVSRQKKRRKKFEYLIKNYPQKIRVLKNQRQLDKYIKEKKTFI